LKALLILVLHSIVLVKERLFNEFGYIFVVKLYFTIKSVSAVQVLHGFIGLAGADLRLLEESIFSYF
jgi:hypothetical protein